MVAIRIETAFILLWPGAPEKRGRVRLAQHAHLVETSAFQLLILVPPPSSVLNLPSSPQCQVSDNQVSPMLQSLLKSPKLAHPKPARPALTQPFSQKPEESLLPVFSSPLCFLPVLDGVGPRWPCLPFLGTGEDKNFFLWDSRFCVYVIHHI